VTDPRQATYCRTCRQPLNVYTDPAGPIRFLHGGSGAADYPAQPVPLSDLPDAQRRCDFCSTPDPVWIYTAADQHTGARTVTRAVVAADDYRDRHHAARIRRADTTPGPVHAWGAQWAACDGCADLIEARDLYGLIGRVVDAMPANLTRGRRLARVRGELTALYTTLLDTLVPGRHHPPGAPN
jgi:hypothetical protein